MGKSEKVEAGSLQYHPSSDEFDSGVDDLTTPKWYIVWSTHMNTHILPEYIVSFRSSCHQSQGILSHTITVLPVVSTVNGILMWCNSRSREKDELKEKAFDLQHVIL